MKTKKCVACKQELPTDDFNFKNKAKNQKQSRCRTCSNKYNRKYYQEGEKTNQLKRVKANNKIVREKYNEWKNDKSCSNCEESANECLELHHLDPSLKEGAPSQIIGSKGWKAFLKEAEKCIILCSNCHKKVHSGRIKLTETHIKTMRL